MPRWHGPTPEAPPPPPLPAQRTWTVTVPVRLTPSAQEAFEMLSRALQGTGTTAAVFGQALSSLPVYSSTSAERARWAQLLGTFEPSEPSTPPQKQRTWGDLLELVLEGAP